MKYEQLETLKNNTIVVKLNKKERINHFWDWFNAHKYYYDTAVSAWDPGLKLLNKKFKQIDRDAWIDVIVQIDGEGERELIISADGNMEYFSLVREIVAAAPDMIGWKAVAFEQPQKEGFILRYKRYTIDTSTMYCMPMILEDEFAVVLYSSNLKKVSDEDSHYITKSILKQTIGEYHFSTKVSIYYIQDISEAEEDELIPLSQLYDFVVNNFMNVN